MACIVVWHNYALRVDPTRIKITTGTGEIMDWYYYLNQTQTGPVNEKEFNSLVNSGTITGDTLVWHSGLTGWQEYGSLVSPETEQAVVLAEGQVVCSECGGAFAEDDVIKHGDSIICEDCKPIFLQKLKDGAWDKGLHGEYQYGGFWIRVGAKIIDGIIISILQWIIMIPLTLLMGSALEDPNVGIIWTIGMNIITIGMNVAFVTFFTSFAALGPPMTLIVIAILRFATVFILFSSYRCLFTSDNP